MNEDLALDIENGWEEVPESPFHIAATVLLNLTAGVDPQTTAAATDQLRAAGVMLVGSPLAPATWRSASHTPARPPTRSTR